MLESVFNSCYYILLLCLAHIYKNIKTKDITFFLINKKNKKQKFNKLQSKFYMVTIPNA